VVVVVLAVGGGTSRLLGSAGASFRGITGGGALLTGVDVAAAAVAFDDGAAEGGNVRATGAGALV